MICLSTMLHLTVTFEAENIYIMYRVKYDEPYGSLWSD